MKLTDKLIEKFGVDKILHCVAAWAIVTLGVPFGQIGVFVSGIIAIILAVVKEGKLDEHCDSKDFAASIVGVLSAIVYFIIFD